MSNVCDYLLTEFKELETDKFHHDYSFGRLVNSYKTQDILLLIQGYVNVLNERKVSKGDAIICITGASLNSLSLIMAGMCYGVVVIPVSPLCGEKQLHGMLKTHKPALICIEQALPKSISSLLGNLKVELLNLTEINQNDFSVKAINSFNDFIKPVKSDDPALIIYSSGTEGDAKVICHTHGSLKNFFKLHQKIYRQYYSEQEKAGALISVFPLSHLAGIVVNIQSLMLGAQTHVLDLFDPVLMLKLISKEKVKFISLVSSMYPKLLEEKVLLQKLDFSPLKYCIALGESCSNSLLSRISSTFSAQALAVYGMTECLPGLGHCREDLIQVNTPLGSCGKSLFPELKLVNEQGYISKSKGRLWITNDSVFECYQDEELNNEFLKGGWFVSNDIFQCDSQGFYTHLGRVDNVFKSKGKAVSTLEVENIALSIPGVGNACCIPLLDKFGQNLIALLVEGQVTNNEVIRAYQKTGVSFLLPSIVKTVQRIPELTSGKIDRLKAKNILQEAQKIQRSVDYAEKCSKSI